MMIYITPPKRNNHDFDDIDGNIIIAKAAVVLFGGLLIWMFLVFFGIV